jgi:hypothetical protein
LMMYFLQQLKKLYSNHKHDHLFSNQLGSNHRSWITPLSFRVVIKNKKDESEWYYRLYDIIFAYSDQKRP